MPFADDRGQAPLLSDGSALMIGGAIAIDQVDTDASPYQPVGWTARFIPEPEAGG